MDVQRTDCIASPVSALKAEDARVLAKSGSSRRVARYQNAVSTTVQSLRIPDLKRASRADILAYFQNGWDLYETLKAAMLDDSVYYMAPDKLRRPLVFYLGHTAVLFVNKLLGAKLIADRVNPYFESIFAVGVDEMSWDDMDDTKYQWPTIQEVWDYRKKVHDIIVDIINDPARIQIPVPADVQCWDHPLWALAMGFEHERIHFETSSVLMRQLPVDLVVAPPGWKYAPLKTPNRGDAILHNAYVDVPGVTVTLGKSMQEGTYGWDNEYGFRTETVQSFKATKYLITNREFYQFVMAGGYENQAYWDEEGWKWKMYRGAEHPLWWVEIVPDGTLPKGSPMLARASHVGPSMVSRGTETERQFKYRAMFDETPMPWEWPAEVNFHEAKAYCRWLGPGHRLPSEAEYNAMRGCTPLSAPVDSANIEMRFGSPSPVDFYPPNHLGFHDIRGNVWQWSEEHAHAFDGFKVHTLYDDFSTPCFDDRHNMIFGGSWVSTGDEATPFARFYFRRHFFQHAGFRVVKADHDVGNKDSSDLDLLVHAHMAFYFEEPAESFPFALPNLAAASHYSARLAQECTQLAAESGAQQGRALDLGCSVGRTSFELARSYGFVMGIDTTARFISACHTLRGDKMKYKRLDEDGTETILTASVDESSIDRTRTEFWQSNLCNLAVHYGKFDLVVISDPLSRLDHPQAVIEHAKDFVNPGGLLVFCAPYDPCRPPKAAGADLSALEAVMCGFKLVATKDVPFAQRQHARSSRVGVAQLAAFKRDTA